MTIAEVFEVAVGAARFVAGHAADAPVDGLAFEAGTGGLDFGDDVTSAVLCSTGVLMESPDGVEDGIPATGARVDKLGLTRRDGDRRTVDGVVVVRIV